MDRFQEMKVLLAVAEAQSLAGGAKLLGISPPGATRAIAALEKRLGTLLLSRNTRRLRLTEAGSRYVEDCKRILLEIEEAEELAAGHHIRPRGKLNVTASVIFGERFLMPLIKDYLVEYTELTVNALLVDRLVNLEDEGLDVAVRIGQIPESGVRALRVGTIRPVICASPAFLDRVGRPERPQDLAEAQTVLSSASPLLTHWNFQHPQGPVSVTPRPRLVVNSNQAAIDAACMGWGYTRVLSYQVAEQVANGQLEIVLDEFCLARLPVHIIYQSAGTIPAKVRTFVDHCYSRLHDHPALRDPVTP